MNGFFHGLEIELYIITPRKSSAMKRLRVRPRGRVSKPVKARIAGKRALVGSAPFSCRRRSAAGSEHRMPHNYVVPLLAGRDYHHGNAKPFLDGRNIIPGGRRKGIVAAGA